MRVKEGDKVVSVTRVMAENSDSEDEIKNEDMDI